MRLSRLPRPLLLVLTATSDPAWEIGDEQRHPFTPRKYEPTAGAERPFLSRHRPTAGVAGLPHSAAMASRRAARQYVGHLSENLLPAPMTDARLSGCSRP